MTPRLTDRDSLQRNRSRAHVTLLQDMCRDEINDRLGLVNRTFTKPAIVTGFPALWGDFLPNVTVVPDKNTLTLEPEAHDLVVHAMALHWADDPVGQLIQCRRALRPDGLFLGAFLGGQTLAELRAALAQAETEILGGLSPRVAPMTDIRDAGGLLQRAGFAMPVADTVALRISYADIFALMHDLRAMGEGNALIDRQRKPTRRAIFDRAQLHYLEHFGEGGRLIAQFELIVLTGWSPSEDQPQPLRPGSATTRLADALSVCETKLKD